MPKAKAVGWFQLPTRGQDQKAKRRIHESQRLDGMSRGPVRMIILPTSSVHLAAQERPIPRFLRPTIMTR